jgi:hypothetical protein
MVERGTTSRTTKFPASKSAQTIISQKTTIHALKAVAIVVETIKTRPMLLQMVCKLHVTIAGGPEAHMVALEDIKRKLQLIKLPLLSMRNQKLTMMMKTLLKMSKRK